MRTGKKIWKKFSNNGKIEVWERDTNWDTNRGYKKRKTPHSQSNKGSFK